MLPPYNSAKPETDSYTFPGIVCGKALGLQRNLPQEGINEGVTTLRVTGRQNAYYMGGPDLCTKRAFLH